MMIEKAEEVVGIISNLVQNALYFSHDLNGKRFSDIDNAIAEIFSTCDSIQELIDSSWYITSIARKKSLVGRVVKVKSPNDDSGVLSFVVGYIDYDKALVIRGGVSDPYGGAVSEAEWDSISSDVSAWGDARVSEYREELLISAFDKDSAIAKAIVKMQFGNGIPFEVV